MHCTALFHIAIGEQGYQNGDCPRVLYLVRIIEMTKAMVDTTIQAMSGVMIEVVMIKAMIEAMKVMIGSMIRAMVRAMIRAMIEAMTRAITRAMIRAMTSSMIGAAQQMQVNSTHQITVET